VQLPGSIASVLGDRAFSSLEILISVICCVTGKEVEGILQKEKEKEKEKRWGCST